MQKRLLSPSIRYENGKLFVFFRAEDLLSESDQSTHIGRLVCETPALPD